MKRACFWPFCNDMAVCQHVWCIFHSNEFMASNFLCPIQATGLFNIHQSRCSFAAGNKCMATKHSSPKAIGSPVYGH